MVNTNVNIHNNYKIKGEFPSKEFPSHSDTYRYP